MTKELPPKHIVLYADDDEDDLMLVQETFLHYASTIELVTATNGVEALAYLDSLSPIDPAPCLIILDVNMPRLNGKETLKEIRNQERFMEIPVVLFTTSSLLSDKVFAEKYKAVFITKPLNTKQMTAIVDRFLEHCTDEVKKSIKKRLM